MFRRCFEGSIPRSVRFDDQRQILRFGPCEQDRKRFFPDGEAALTLYWTGDEDRALEVCKLPLDAPLIGNEMVIRQGNLPAAQMSCGSENCLGKSTLNKALPELEHQGGFPACPSQTDDSMRA